MIKRRQSLMLKGRFRMIITLMLLRMPSQTPALLPSGFPLASPISKSTALEFSLMQVPVGMMQITTFWLSDGATMMMLETS